MVQRLEPNANLEEVKSNEVSIERGEISVEYMDKRGQTYVAQGVSIRHHVLKDGVPTEEILRHIVQLNEYHQGHFIEAIRQISAEYERIYSAKPIVFLGKK